MGKFGRKVGLPFDGVQPCVCSQGEGHSWTTATMRGRGGHPGRGCRELPRTHRITPEMTTADGQTERINGDLGPLGGQDGGLEPSLCFCASRLSLGYGISPPSSPPAPRTRSRGPGLGAGGHWQVSSPRTSALLAVKWGGGVYLVGWREFDEFTSAEQGAPSAQMC